MSSSFQKALRLFWHIVSVCICNLAAAFLLASVFGFQLATVTYVVLSVTSILMVLIYDGVFPKKPGLYGFALLTAACFALLNNLFTEGISWFTERILYMTKTYYGGHWPADAVTGAELAPNIIVCFYGLFACLLLARAYAGRKGYGFWLLVGGLPIALAFILNVMPSAQVMVVFACTLLYLRLSSVWEHIPGAKMVLCEAVLLVVLAGLSLLLPKLVTEGHFKQWEERSRARKMVRKFNETTMSRIEDFLSDLTGIRLAAERRGKYAPEEIAGDGITRTHKVQLTVKLPKNSPQTYLRGYVGHVYNEKEHRWEEDTGNLFMERRLFGLNDAPEEKPVRFSYEMLSPLLETESEVHPVLHRFPVYRAVMEIRHRAADREIIYTPYCSDMPYNENRDGFYADTDGTWKTKAMPEQYAVSYLYNTLGQPNYAAFSQNYYLQMNDFGYDEYVEYDTERYEQLVQLFEYGYSYAAFALKRYTEVPVEYRNALYKALPEHGPQELIENVQKYMADNYTYTLTPTPNRSGKDPILFFIEDSHQGFCQHYASVAVMLFRMNGVPARYVEGYIIPKDLLLTGKEDGEYVTVDVTDDYAHAWVEIWIDSYGWYPIEVTTGYADEVDMSYLSEKLKEGTPVTPQVTKPVTPEITKKPTEKPVVTKPAKPSEKPPVTKKPSSSQKKQGNSKHVPKYVWVIVGLPLAMALVLTVRFYVINERRRKRFRDKNRNRATLAVYRELVRISEYMGVKRLPGEHDRDYHTRLEERLPEFDYGLTVRAAVEAAQAVFSSEGVSNEQYRTVLRYYRKLRNTYLFGKKKVKRFILVFLKGI